METDARTVVILDEDQHAGERTSRAFKADGWTASLAGDLPTARALLEQEPQGLIVTELRVGGRWAFDFVSELQRPGGRPRIWLLTDYPSVATAVRAIRVGFDAYLRKPLKAKEIGRFFEDSSPEAEGTPWPSLDRTIWEFINQVFTVSGSLSEAARRLRLDRRSLRRMLAKYPPKL